MDKIFDIFSKFKKNKKIKTETWVRNSKQSIQLSPKKIITKIDKSSTLEIDKEDNDNLKNKINLNTINIYNKNTKNRYDDFLNPIKTEEKNVLKDLDNKSVNRSINIFEKNNKTVINQNSSINDEIYKRVINNEKISVNNSFRENYVKKNSIYSNKKRNIFLENNFLTNKLNSRKILPKQEKIEIDSKYNKYKIYELKCIYKDKKKELAENITFHENIDKELKYLKQINSNINNNESNLRIEIDELKKKCFELENKKWKVEDKYNILKKNYNLRTNKTYNLQRVIKLNYLFLKEENKNINNEIQKYVNTFSNNYEAELNENIVKFQLSDDALKRELTHFINLKSKF